MMRHNGNPGPGWDALLRVRYISRCSIVWKSWPLWQIKIPLQIWPKLHEWMIFRHLHPDSFQVATYTIFPTIWEYLGFPWVSLTPTHHASHTTPCLRSPKELPSQARQGSHGESQPGQVPRPSDRPHHGHVRNAGWEICGFTALAYGFHWKCGIPKNWKWIKMATLIGKMNDNEGRWW